MPIYLRQSTASQEIPLGPFLDSTDGDTEKTALTIANTDIKVWKTGATTLASKNSGGATHIANGRYYAVLDATDTDTIGPLVVFIHVAAALAVRLECCVLDEAVYDAMFGTVALSTYAGGDTSGVATLLSRIASALTITTGKVDVNDKTGFSLSTAGVQAIWDALSSALTTVGSIGKRIVDYLTGDIYARVGAPAGASMSADVAAVKVDSAAVKVQTDKLTFTVANQVDSNVLDWKSATAPAMTGDAFARLGASAGASVSADIAAIQSDTDNIQTRLPAALVSGRMDSSVGAMAADTLTAAALATDAVTEIQSGLSTLTTGNIPTVAAIADGVWDEAISGHLTGGTTGASLNGAGAAGDPWTATIPGSYGAGTAGKIVGDNLNATVSSVKVKTDNLPASPAAVGSQMDLVNAPNATAITAIQSGLALQSLLVTVAGYIDTEVAAIKAKTDNLPSDPADASDIAASFASIASTLATIASYIDTEVAAIKVKTDNIPAAPAAVGDIPTAAQNADKLLGRNLAGGADGTRTVQDALRLLRNKVDMVSVPGSMVVMAEDDTTEAWRAAVSRDATADPVVAVDPT